MGFKQRYCNWKLSKELANIKRTPVIRNIDDVRKVGVIWQPTQKDAEKFLKDYFNKNQIIYRSFCVFDENSNPSASNNSLTTNDLDWWGIPRQEKVGEFMQMNFDVLINISLNQNFALNYLTALTQSDLKIGYSPREQNYFDLNIKIKENQDSMYLAKQQIFYLAQLNQNS